MIAFLALIDAPNDKEKFIELYNQYHNLIYWIAYNRVHSVEDAEECVQDTFFYVAKHIDKIDDIYSKRTKGYGKSIALNIILPTS